MEKNNVRKKAIWGVIGFIIIVAIVVGIFIMKDKKTDGNNIQTTQDNKSLDEPRRSF